MLIPAVVMSSESVAWIIVLQCNKTFSYAEVDLIFLGISHYHSGVVFFAAL